MADIRDIINTSPSPSASPSPASVPNGNTAIVIPEGRPKSGRFWKKKQVYRSSTQQRQGVLKHLSTDFEERKLLQAKKKQMKDYEKELKEQTKQKKIETRKKREEKQRRRMENEYKTVVVQQINPQKIKGMSKKQLRSIRKTSMNKNGQVELVSPWK